MGEAAVGWVGVGGGRWVGSYSQCLQSPRNVAKLLIQEEWGHSKGLAGEPEAWVDTEAVAEMEVGLVAVTWVRMWSLLQNGRRGDSKHWRPKAATSAQPRPCA